MKWENDIPIFADDDPEVLEFVELDDILEENQDDQWCGGHRHGHRRELNAHRRPTREVPVLELYRIVREL